MRAIAKATGKTWDEIYIVLSAYGYFHKRIFTANSVWGAYLRSQGFKQHLVDDHGRDLYTVEDFCWDNPTGTYVLAIDGHVVCVEDGCYYDSWDSGQEIPIYYWAR